MQLCNYLEFQQFSQNQIFNILMQRKNKSAALYSFWESISYCMLQRSGKPQKTAIRISSIARHVGITDVHASRLIKKLIEFDLIEKLPVLRSKGKQWTIGYYAPGKTFKGLYEAYSRVRHSSNRVDWRIGRQRCQRQQTVKEGAMQDYKIQNIIVQATAEGKTAFNVFDELKKNTINDSEKGIIKDIVRRREEWTRHNECERQERQKQSGNVNELLSILRKDIQNL